MLALLPGARGLRHCSRAPAAQQSISSLCSGPARGPWPCLQSLQAQEPLLWVLALGLMQQDHLSPPAAVQGKETTQTTRIKPSTHQAFANQISACKLVKIWFGKTLQHRRGVKGQYCPRLHSSPRGLNDSSLKTLKCHKPLDLGTQLWEQCTEGMVLRGRDQEGQYGTAPALASPMSLGRHSSL